MRFVSRRSQDEILLGGKAGVTTDTGDGGEVTPGSDAQVTPSREATAQLGDAGTGVVGTAASSSLGLGADQVDVVTGDAAAGRCIMEC
ncbi:hypothetical protein BJP27_01790 [Pseudomonas oryzihabitans]|nr:hypothetical protein BJP27_01790 [Pseudomonas psychrotolerans]